MTLIERPLLGKVDIQTPDYEAMGFVLGYARLGEDSLGDGTTGEVWVSWIDSATDISITRGGARSGLGITMDVGRCSFRLKAVQDPNAGGTFDVNQAIRVVAGDYVPGEYDNRVPIFTGRISDISAAYPFDKGDGVITPYVTVTASDAIKQHVATTRYGVRITDNGYETFESRMGRLATSSKVPIVVPVEGAPVEVYRF